MILAASAVGLALALGCAFAWAGLDAIRKQLSAEIAPLALLVLLNTCLLPIFASWWFVVGGGITDLSAYAVYGGAGLVLQIVANVLFLSALRASPLSLTIPFLSLSPAFTTLGGMVLLNEQPGRSQLVGVGLVVAGALVLGSGPGESGESGEPKGNRRRRFVLLRALVHERGAMMMTGVALCWSVTMTLDKQALAYATVPIHALIQLLGVLLAALLYLIVRGRLGELRVARSSWRHLGVAVLIFALAFALQLSVIQSVLVAEVETLKRAIGLISAVVLGKLLFDESIGVLTLVGVGSIVVGVALVML